ncbi:MAG TPA: hypothetical protein VFL81_00495 [Candidatus Saccharimonadales bacterium]|nr:hypothetical protein [Candidatus Saccharimonadales bacterium]
MNNYQTRRSRNFNTREERMWQRGQNTVAFRPTGKFGPVTHTIVVALMVAVLGLIYLTQVTRTSSYAYQLNDAQTTHDKLVAEYQDLKVENARLQSLKTVKDSGVAKAMTEPESTAFAN